MVRAKLILVSFLFFAFLSQGRAAILWTGGEEMDFPNAGVALVTTSSWKFRAGYARFALYPSGGGVISTSKPFPGGAVTSAWVSARLYFNNGNIPYRYLGIGKSGTSHSLWIGNSSAQKLTLWRFDGTTWTNLASESGSSLAYGMIYKLDMHVANYGAAATVKVYLNGATTPLITYTGDVTAGGNTDLDDVRFSGHNDNTALSEFIVADEDTRSMSVVTHAPNAAGTASAWTGAHTDVNELVTNDATVVSSATAGQNFQCNVLDLPAGSFSIATVKISARSSKVGAGVSSIATGVYTNSTVNVPAPVALTTAWDAIDTYYSINPVTSSPWTQTEVNNLQINLQSAP